MVRWEYLTIDLAYLPTSTDDINLLNEAGDQGWELIAIMSNKVAYLRRPINDLAHVPERSRRFVDGRSHLARNK